MICILMMSAFNLGLTGIIVRLIKDRRSLQPETVFNLWQSDMKNNTAHFVEYKLEQGEIKLSIAAMSRMIKNMEETVDKLDENWIDKLDELYKSDIEISKAFQYFIHAEDSMWNKLCDRLNMHDLKKESTAIGTEGKGNS